MNLTDLIPGVRDIVFLVIGAFAGASLLMTAALMVAAGREIPRERA